MIRKNFILACALATALGSAQQHTVVKGDTPYNVARRYGMSLDQLYNLNPKIKNGSLNIGDVISVKGTAHAATTTAAPVKTSAKTGTIILKPKQTIYGITKQYHIAEADLRKLNPELDAHMKIGDLVTLPLDAIHKYGDADVAASVAKEPVKPVDDAVTPESNPASENTYTVQQKDNYYKIGRKFGLSQKELFALNPGLEAKGLQAGDVLVIKGNLPETPASNSAPAIEEKPAATGETTTTRTSSADDFVTYTVQNGDTVFGILNKFGITLNELMALNPNLSNGLKSGMTLKIKKLDPMYVKKSGDVLNVVLMLPFGFSANDAKFRTMSTDFLAGAKLAIERNARNGMKLDIKVIDAGSESSFKNGLVQINPANTDLIIGPFLKSNVLEVLDFVSKDRIPVVAPFANSEDLYGYSNLIIVETNELVYADRIVKEVKDAFSDQKIFIVADASKNNAQYLKAQLEKELKNPNVAIVSNPSEIKADQNMMTGQAVPVIAVLASDNDKTGDAFGNRMIELGREVPGNRAFSMYYSPIFEKKTDDLASVGLVYIMDRKIDPDGDFQKEILADFKQKYCKAPSKYNVIGFDVVNDMLSRENKKGEIQKQMGKTQTQLATKFEFERAKSNGAYVNKGYRVVRLQ